MLIFIQGQLYYLLTYAHCSRWSIGHQLPLAIALCSGLLLSFRTSWSPAVSALLQYLTSNWCEAGLSSSSPVGSRSGLSVWCWMLASWGCVRSSPTSSPVSAWPLVPSPIAPTDLHFGSSLVIGFCRCASDRCWRMSGSFVALSMLSAKSHIRKAGLTSHWSWRCRVWFSCWFLQMPKCFWAWRRLLLPCWFWLWRLSLCLPVGQPHFPDRRKTPPPLWALHQLWLVCWQFCSSSSAQSQLYEKSKTLVSIYSEMQSVWIKFSLLPQPVGLLKLMLNLFCTKFTIYEIYTGHFPVSGHLITDLFRCKTQLNSTVWFKFQWPWC